MGKTTNPKKTPPLSSDSSFWFASSVPEPEIPEFNRGLLASLTPGNATEDAIETGNSPSLTAPPSHASHFTPFAALKKVPEESHRTTSIEEEVVRTPPPVREGIGRSLLIHSALLTLALLKGIFLPGNPVVITPTLRVDLVGLPDLTRKDLEGVNAPPPDLVDALKKAEQAAQEQVAREDIEQKAAKKAAQESRNEAAPIDEDPNEPTVAMKDKTKDKEKAKEKEKQKLRAEKEREAEEKLAQKEKMKRAVAKMKAMGRLEAIKNSESMERTEGLENRPGVLIKGNRLSQGSSLDGDAREAAEGSYYERVRDRLVAHWALPPWLARQNYQAQVVIFIDERGRLRDFRFTRASGNEPFDAAVKKTLQESAPFVPPPKAVASDVLNRGILVGFPL
jgi:outer membrane biosynthesis protein TonB